VSASGADIFDTQDEFRFVYATLSGDGEVTARLNSLNAPNDWTKSGVMIRESLDANASFASTLVTHAQGAVFIYRQATAAEAVRPTAALPARAPYWIRMRRAGNVFISYFSADGATWTQGGSVTIAMNATAYVGLALSSHLDGSLATAQFSSVSIDGGSTAPPPSTPPPSTSPPTTESETTPPPSSPPPSTTWTSSDIGAVGAAGSTSFANGVYTVKASGEDISGTADEFRFVYATLNGDGEIVARLDSLTVPHSWTKAGVMIRESLSANARFASTLATGNQGGVFMYRSTTDGQATRPAAVAANAPCWVRLRRAGNVFTADFSADGTTWTPGGSATIAMNASAYVGLALTSHDDGRTATAKFSNVSTDGSSTPPPTTPPPTTPPPTSGSARLTWTAPTTNTNGEPLTDLTSFKLYWGTSPGSYASQLTINNPSTTTWTLDNLAGGRWYFAVTALDVTGAESPKSNEATKLIQ
jgi:regulation of enolase protein 1 (concanavalin A-like superfamily)